ncbi:aminoacyl-histidine dipeptidase [Brenneria goodwinii]|uniref:aminoacyl-histidine dipeptidase n=1 Tax=Brenneria goodwinii TaxID=1109412 RepID=UPI00065DC759|nr:aminoacyl-histidine dipeptidase [Brenneria goodwinii]MCG8158012.1 aminoacyl-histidine dipeptidase [Brenneria goodwinii]MCG8161268.1 aminoacyl-histidine dipeptidase [Brenneria goodwinii]MCG8165378.1 aminoacyl-histidine dipeptidase [Brenneria goodwinii]MCG8171331.1 aminoacyl-histidine dipeptidase [Brenneria goodwinii]MCG8176404.1 aminoacyl-histidine dipeptidase [Brenneria goodwinii]
MGSLSHLSPQPLWDRFADICSIPHPSYHEEQLARYLVSWAQKKGLSARRDSAGNVFIDKPATPGRENRVPVILQAHLDMVPQKAHDKQHDFTRDPIEPYEDDGWVKARQTTLGADNGIGLASILAVLESSDVKHGPLEALLTMTEETGMIGAKGLEPGWLRGDILINTDSGTEGEIYMGCAGGVDAIVRLPVGRGPRREGDTTLELSIDGLVGGHSGGNIALGLGNAYKLMARFLYQYADACEARLSALSGNKMRNAIPAQAKARLSVPTAKLGAFKQAVDAFSDVISRELTSAEPNLTVSLTGCDAGEAPLDLPSQQRMIALLRAMPHGVIRMSDTFEGVVETSLNMGVVELSASQVEINCLVRSLLDSGKDDVVDTLGALARLAGADFHTEGAYPGWAPDRHSRIKTITEQCWQRLFGGAPSIKVVHAGLECGLFKQHYPSLDMVSIGPTMLGAHSPQEKVNIASVGRYWTLLTEMLDAIPQR